MRDVPDEIYQTVAENPIRILKVLRDTETPIPDATEFMLLCLKVTAPKFDIRFYAAQEDFLLDYTACLLRDRDDYDFHVFRSTGKSGWEFFLPPPIVGVGLKTRLRSGGSF
jgi:hypothetical protein